MSTPFLKTKLYIPPRKPNRVPRPHLIGRMVEALRLQHYLTLVSAKAGSGKTTLVSEWVNQQKRPATWLSLDESDNDPRRFINYLVAALRQLDAKIGQVALHQLENPQLPQAEAIIVELINDLANISSPALLVLDDYHLIQNEWIHEAVGFLAEHPPPGIHLVILTRADPPLPLARLRGRGQITEIRDHDLRFSEDETCQYLNAVMALDLPADIVAALEWRTEGWIAGLQLAAISMQSRKGEREWAAFIDAFSGTNRFILDYLMEEVLNQQSPHIQDFLLETSLLERMCAGLCDAVHSGKAVPYDSQAILLQLERTNLFVMPLDDERRWYRYHHLFADLLRITLRQRRSTDEIRELHRRAGRWHQSEGSIEEAMIHAMAAQDFERAASMIVENIVSMLSSRELPVLLAWIEKLPEEIVRNHPWIDVYHANTLALGGRLEQVDSLLERVEKRVEADAPGALELLGHAAAVRAYAANLRGNAARVIEMAALAKKYLPAGHLTARGMAAYALADTYFASDDMDQASQALLEMLRIGEKTGHLMLIVPALCDLAAIRKVQGRLQQAMELYDQAHQWMLARDGLDSRVRCSYEFGLADLLREWNQLEAAHEHAVAGTEYRKRLGGYWVTGDLPLMRVLQARGDVDGALDALRNAEQIVGTHHFQIAVLTEFKAARVVQWLAVGDVPAAAHWVEECRGRSELEQIALARLRLAQGRAAEAQAMLSRQAELAESGGRLGRLIEILCLESLALEAQARPDEAEDALSRALSLARPEGYLRVFLDLGRRLYEILERMAARCSVERPHDSAITRITRDYMYAILAAFRQEMGLEASEVPGVVSSSSSLADGLVDSLTERELEVLCLLAEGLTNKEIASKLVVAPSTVKQHLKNIYTKLDVHSRTQAVARGRELELL